MFTPFDSVKCSFKIIKISLFSFFYLSCIYFATKAILRLLFSAPVSIQSFNNSTGSKFLLSKNRSNWPYGSPQTFFYIKCPLSARLQNQIIFPFFVSNTNCMKILTTACLVCFLSLALHAQESIYFKQDYKPGKHYDITSINRNFF